MGAAGDMLTAALYELLDDDKKAEFIDTVNSLGLEGVSIKAEKSIKCGITGTHMSVSIYGLSEGSHDHHDHDRDHDPDHDHDHGHHHGHDHHDDHDPDHDHDHDHEHDHHHDHDHEHGHHHDHDHDHDHPHHHNDMDHIVHAIDHMPIEDRARRKIKDIYGLIAEAESHVHGMDVSSVHFHEVGEKDALADIAGVCILMDMLSPDLVTATPVCTGYGKVRCAHGILPVPAPATARLLDGISAYSGNIEGELCTPTGAALVKYFVDSFEGMPVMTVERTGYGMGSKDLPAANTVRAMLGEGFTKADTAGHDEPTRGNDGSKNEVTVLSCNVDDMTAEAVSYATDLFIREGALDVYTLNIGMKKGRQGIMINVMCLMDDVEKFVQLMFRHTSTLGIRRQRFDRYVLDRRIEKVSSSYGDVRVKISEGYGITRRKYENDDICRIANEKGISIDEIMRDLNGEIYGPSTD